MKKLNLTPEQVELGKIYAWIHQRAKILRASSLTKTV